MPEFVNPFSGVVPDRKLTKGELIRALRLNIAAELEAVHLYEAHADATDNPFAAKVLRDVANEERVHVGEFQQLIKMLLDDETAWLEIGAHEVIEMAEEVAQGDTEPASPEEKAAEEGITEEEPAYEIPAIGSMKE